jgi:hypothetical protein
MIPSKLNLSREHEGSISDKASAPVLPIEFPAITVNWNVEKKGVHTTEI